MRKIFLAGVILLIIGAPALPDETLSLGRSIDIAMKNSETVKIAQAKLDQANSLAGQAFSAFLPQMRLDASFGRSYQQQPPVIVTKDTFMPGVPPEDSEYQFDSNELDTFAYSGTLNQNIFTWGKVYNSWQVANLGAEIAREELRRTEIGLTYDVISAYYNVIKARKARELAEEALNLTNNHLKQTKVMFGSGVVTKAEVLRAELEVAKSELALSKAKGAVLIVENAFNVTLGRAIDEPVLLDETDFSVGKIMAPNYKEFLDLAYRSRPEWKIARYGRDIADKGKWISYSGFLPVFFLSGTYGYSNLRDPVFDTDSQLKNWNIALVSSWTIFDGFATPHRVWEAYAKYTEAAEGEELLRKNIAIEVKDATLKLSSTADELAAAKKALELAGENHKIAETRFSSGVGTNIEAIDARTMLTSAKLDYLEAEFGYELAKAGMNKVVGAQVLMKEKTGDSSSAEMLIRGEVRYVELEGGFVGLIADDGRRYTFVGENAKAISDAVGKSTAARKISVVGRVREDIATTAMWGKPIEVSSFKFE